MKKHVFFTTIFTISSIQSMFQYIPEKGILIPISSNRFTFIQTPQQSICTQPHQEVPFNPLSIKDYEKRLDELHKNEQLFSPNNATPAVQINMAPILQIMQTRQTQSNNSQKPLMIDKSSQTEQQPASSDLSKDRPQKISPFGCC